MSADAEFQAEDFQPGSFGCHEALHMASFLCNAVDVELCEHQAITMNEEWLRLAETAQIALQKLYDAIAEAHTE